MLRVWGFVIAICALLGFAGWASDFITMQGERTIYRERGVPHYQRTIVLPAEVDQAQSQAKVENGVLTLTLVKKVPTGALQISVN